MNTDYNFFVSALTPFVELGHHSTEAERTRAAEAIAILAGSLPKFNLSQRVKISNLLDRVVTEEQANIEHTSSRLGAMRDRVIDYVSKTLTVVDDFSSCSHASLISRANGLKNSINTLYDDHPEVFDFDLAVMAKASFHIGHPWLKENLEQAVIQGNIPRALKMLPYMDRFFLRDENNAQNPRIFRPLILAIIQSDDPKIIRAICKCWTSLIDQNPQTSPFGDWNPVQELASNPRWQNALSQMEPSALFHMLIRTGPGNKTVFDYEREAGSSQLFDAISNYPNLSSEVIDCLIGTALKFKEEEKIARLITERIVSQFPVLSGEELVKMLNQLVHTYARHTRTHGRSDSRPFRSMIEATRQSDNPKVIHAIFNAWEQEKWHDFTVSSAAGDVNWDPIQELASNPRWQEALLQMEGSVRWMILEATSRDGKKDIFDYEKEAGSSRLFDAVSNNPDLTLRNIVYLARRATELNEEGKAARLIERVIPLLLSDEHAPELIIRSLSGIPYFRDWLLNQHDPVVLRRLIGPAITLAEAQLKNACIEKVLTDATWGALVAENEQLLKVLINRLTPANYRGIEEAACVKIIKKKTGLWQAMSAAQVVALLEQEWTYLISFRPNLNPFINSLVEDLLQRLEPGKLRDSILLRRNAFGTSIYHNAMATGNLELLSLLQKTYPQLFHLHMQELASGIKGDLCTPVGSAISMEQNEAAIAIVPELAACVNALKSFPSPQSIDPIAEAFLNAIDQKPDQLLEILTRLSYLGVPSLTKQVLWSIESRILALLDDEQALRKMASQFPHLLQIFEITRLSQSGLVSYIYEEFWKKDSLLFKVLQETPSPEQLALLQHKDGENNNLLHLAAQSNNVSALRIFPVQELLSALSYRNDVGETPLALAAKARHWEFILEIFTILGTGPEAGNNLESLKKITDREGRTVFDLVTAMGEIPQGLLPRTDQIVLSWQETLAQQISQLNSLEELLGEEVTVFPETSDFLVLTKQIAESSSKIAAIRQEVWDRRATHSPLFLLPNQEELSRATLTRFSFESGVASLTIPRADPAIDITQLLRYLDQIEGSLPANIKDEGRIRPREEVLTRLRKQLTAFAQNGKVQDELNNLLSENFQDQVANVLRHLVASLNKKEAAIAAAPEEERPALQESLNHDLKEILWERLGPDLFHCHDRLATDCEDLYYEYVAVADLQTHAESKQLSSKILRKLLQFRRNLFHASVSHIKEDRHVAATHRYYRALLGKEFGIGSTEMSQENAQYAGHRLMGQEGRIREEMREALAPEKVAAYIAGVIGDPNDKEITPLLVTEWIQNNYPDYVADFFLPNGSWNPMAIAILLQDLNILKRIGMEPPPSFGNKELPPLPPPPAGEPLSLEHRLQAFDRYVERAEESRNLEELSGTIIDLLNRWQELIGTMPQKDEAQVLPAHEQLLDYLEGRWNKTFKLLMAQVDGIERKKETMQADRAILQGIDNQLNFLNADDFQDEKLEHAPQFQPIFAGARLEKQAYKRAIDDLKQRIDALAALEEQERNERELVRKEKEQQEIAEAEAKARAAEAISSLQANVESALTQFHHRKERNMTNKEELKLLLEEINSPEIRYMFREAGPAKALQQLRLDIRALINSL